ncbi:MAG TPA: alpha/beta hydrolase [Deltaproteobacteria bacterium]|nr:alpha/beta hydrolase [Deltaproteobacteria bacterium]HOI07119.1 alpha/beta hydrolase [Deltaproteobacteria bacterium]
MHTSETIAHVNGIDIAYDTFGDRSCPPVVLIMGLSMQMISWEDDFCARLAHRGYWVVRFDNRDAGRSTKLDALGVPDLKTLLSGKPPAGLYTLQDMAEDTVGLLDTLGIDSAHFVGASMGGMISQILGMDHPERVRTLTVVMSTTGSPLLPPPKPEAIRVLFMPFPTEEQSFVEYFVEMWGTLNGSTLPVDEQRIGIMARRMFGRGLSVPGNARQLAAVYASGSRKERLGAVKAPTLVIHGDEDPLLPVECGIDVARSIPGAELKVITGMGHALNPAVWDEIIDSVDRHVRASERSGRAGARIGT